MSEVYQRLDKFHQVIHPHEFQDISRRTQNVKLWVEKYKKSTVTKIFYSKTHYLYQHSHAIQKEKSFEVSWLNPLWTINVCTNSLAVHSLVETRLKWTDWLLCFTLKNSVWVFRILEGTFHDEQTELSKENHWSKALTSYNAGLLHLIYSCGL